MTKVDKKVNNLIKTFQKVVFDEALVAVAVRKLKRGEKKRAFLLAMAKWKALADFSQRDLESYLYDISEYEYSTLCGLCKLYSGSCVKNICVKCPISPKEANDSGCCIEFNKFTALPTLRRALAVYNRIKKAYIEIYGE